MITVLLIVLLVLALFGGWYGYGRRVEWGPAPYGLAGVLLIVVLVLLLARVL